MEYKMLSKKQIIILKQGRGLVEPKNHQLRLVIILREKVEFIHKWRRVVRKEVES